MPARLPDFLGLGTQKGGTSSLHQWLDRHPQVYLPECKEVHYFDINSRQPIKWYKKYFEQANEKQKCGEITPFYLFHPKAPKRIHKLLPNVKMIVLLRDPAERTISQIIHSRQRNFETLTPREALEAEEERLNTGSLYSLQKHSYISRSKYLEQLDRYEKLFNKDQLLVMKSEDLFANQEYCWQQVQMFLDLEETPLKGNFPRINKKTNKEIEIPKDLRDEIRDLLVNTAKGVRERYGFGWEWDKHAE